MKMSLASDTVAGPAMPTPKNKKKKFDDWEIRDAADTLMKAEDIKGNADLLPHVHAHLATKQKGMKKAITNIQELRTAAKNFQGA